MNAFISNNIDMTILRGERAWHCRKQLGLTQVQLAERAGLRQSLISEIENGVLDEDAKLGIVWKLAEALEVAPEYLLGLSDDPLRRLHDMDMEESAPKEDDLQKLKRIVDVIDQVGGLEYTDRLMQLALSASQEEIKAALSFMVTLRRFIQDEFKGDFKEG